MLSGPQVPPAKLKLGIDLKFSEELLCDDEQQLTPPEPLFLNGLGIPFRQVGDCATLPFITSSAVTKLRSDWIARSDDVFVVLPGACPGPFLQNYIYFTAALVEQCQLESVDRNFPRWLDAAVSRRGWDFVEHLDTIAGRRVLWTHNPPSIFPCSNIGLQNDMSQGSCSTAPASVSNSDIDMPRIIVFVTDPRAMALQDIQGTRAIMSGFNGRYTDGEMNLSRVMEFVLADSDANSPQQLFELNHCNRGNPLLSRTLTNSLPFHGAIRNVAEWAEMEASYPDRVRLVFIDDFYSDPKTAVAGIMSFLDVPLYTNISEELVRQSSQVATCSPSMNFFHAESELKLGDSDHLLSRLIQHFDSLLENAPVHVERAWQSMLELWIRSPNARLAAWAHAASEHAPWNPPRYWAAHSARMCRPCLFFPRGKCDSTSCNFCHGPGHHKPKRPNKHKRNARRRYDRTPSPEGYPRMTLQLDDVL